MKNFTMKSILFLGIFLGITQAQAYQLSSLIHDGVYICHPTYINARMDGKSYNETIPMNQRRNSQVRLVISNNRRSATFNGQGPLIFDGARSYRHNYHTHGWYKGMPGGFIGVVSPSAWGNNGLYATFYAYRSSNAYLKARLECKRQTSYYQ